MGRLKDAYNALLGQSWWESDLALMRTQWAHLMLEVADTMELLQRQVGRINVARRRDRKSAKDEIPSPVAAAPSSPVQGRWATKAAMRRQRLGRPERSERLAASPEPEEEIEEAK